MIERIDGDTPVGRVRRHYEEFKQALAEQGHLTSRAERSVYLLLYAATAAESNGEGGAALAMLAEDFAVVPEAARPPLEAATAGPLRRVA